VKKSEAGRCAWATTPESIAYHDGEWGKPSRDDRHLFEMLTLEGAQAGLSWETILRKRERYREVFHDFDPARVARITAAGVERLMRDPGIVRNRAKIESTVSNAKAFLAIQREFGSFANYAWPFVGGKPLDGRRPDRESLPGETTESKAFSKDLRKRGFRFVGPTIMYAFMQAVGMVNDHTLECPWHDRRAR
jgi:DNA-3-methyladenine glycosylase I